MNLNIITVVMVVLTFILMPINLKRVLNAHKEYMTIDVSTIFYFL